MKDRFTTLADVSLTYMLMDTATSTVVSANVVTGVAKASGKIGEEPTLS